MAEAVPLRAALQRHHDHVVRGTDAALVEHASIGVGAGAQHRVQRIDASERGILALSALGTGVVEVERKRDHFAFADQACGGDDILRPGMVQRADLVLGPPAPQFLYLSAAFRRSSRVSLRSVMVWRSSKGRRIAYQAAAIGAGVLVAWFLISNTIANLEERRIASGFGFLQREASRSASRRSCATAPPILTCGPSLWGSPIRLRWR